MAPLRWTDLSCQHIKLVSKRHAIAARHVELAFANHVHEVDSGQNSLRGSERFESEHRPNDAFGGAVILLDNIVEILDLPERDRNVSFGFQLVEHSLVGATFIHRYRTGYLAVLHRLVKETPGR